MSQCGKCGVVIAGDQDNVACEDCKQVFHIACAKLKRSTSGRKPTWKCETCRSEVSSVGSRTSDGDGDKLVLVLATIEAMRSDMSNQLKQVNDNVVGIKAQLATVNTTVEGLKTSLQNLHKENEERKAECAKLRETNDEMRGEIDLLRGQLLDLQQYTRKENVEIIGVPCTPNEDLSCVLKKLADVIGVPFSRSDVSAVHRLAVTRRNKHPTIIVKFVQRTIKNEWVLAARRCKLLTAAELCDGWESTRVFVNDHLTISNKAVLGYARSLVRSKKLAFAWCKDCRIMVKKTPDGPTRTVCSKNEVNQAADHH